MIITRPGIISRLSIKPNYTGDYIGCFGHRKYMFNSIPQELYEHLAVPLYFQFKQILTATQSKSMSDLISAISYKKWGVQWDTVETIRFEDCTRLYPIVNGNYLYASDIERIRLFTLDTNQLVNRKLLHSNLAAINYSYKFPDVEVIENVVTYSDILFYFITNRELQYRTMEVNYEVKMLENQGVNVATDVSDIRQWIASEIALQWNIKRVVKDGIVYYSQTPQNILSPVPTKPTKPIRRSRINKPRSNVKMANTKNDDINYRLSPLPLPYQLTDGEFGQWLERSVNQILIGNIPIIRLVGSINISQEELLNDVIKKYNIMQTRNPWLSSFTPSVTADNQILLPVLGPDDLTTYLNGITPGVTPPNVTRNIPGVEYTLNDTKVTLLSDGCAYNLSNITPWAAHLLITTGFPSITI